MSETEYIIHADDFGLNEGVNDCICECFQKGWIHETSLMVNMPTCDSAVSQAERIGFLHAVGLHLNLTSGKPLTSAIRNCKRFCNAEGFFNKTFHLSKTGRFFLSAEEKCAVEREIEAQVDKFCNIAGVMRKLDSHHHVHTDWAIYEILRPIAIRHGITSMRISADMHKVSLGKRIYKGILNRDIRKHFRSTSHFDDAGWCVNRPRGGIVEVMVHPQRKKNGIIYDTRTKFEELYTKLMSVPNSKIRDCNLKSNGL